MNIWLTRHGQTVLNLEKRMQGRSDLPLNETGQKQARLMRSKIAAEYPDLHFDAVFASPLRRAVATGSIIGNVPEESIQIDARLIETDFGCYERKKYYLLGPRMTLYWALPELFPAPPTVETTASMVKRAHSFLKELEEMPYDTVLIACHGGIYRSLCGYLEDAPRGYRWRPKPHNCEVRIYSTSGGTHRRIRNIKL